MRLKHFLLLAMLCSAMLAGADEPQPGDADAAAFFQSSRELPWNEVFHFAGSEDWTEKWFLDGLKAHLKPTDKGLVFTSGWTRDDHASHAVLWTRREFKGDILVQYDYTRLDTVDYAVNILYLQAQGIGEGIFATDISEWNEYREVPYMRHYFDNMNLLHISYAAHYNRDDQPREQYVHARRYPTGPDRTFAETGIGERRLVGQLIAPGVTYEITAAKIGERLLFSVKPKGQGEKQRQSFVWDTSAFDRVTEGRIGLRQMWTRSARYANFRVFELMD